MTSRRRLWESARWTADRETSLSADPSTPTRFLSEGECLALLERAAHMGIGGGTTALSVESTWTGNLRWARNQITTGGDVHANDVWMTRMIRGASAQVVVSDVADPAVHAAVRRAERLLLTGDESDPSSSSAVATEPYAHPAIWSDATYGLEAEQRAQAMHDLVQSADRAGMLSFGYIQVSAHGRAVLDTNGVTMYYPFTWAEYSVTVRSPDGTASGWAGVDSHDWRTIDAAHLSAVALEKCLRSRTPAAVEPGRYTVVLEPQAVCDFCDALCSPMYLDYEFDAHPLFFMPYFDEKDRRTHTKLGHKIIDARFSLTADPMDPACAFPPFDRAGQVYRPAKWFDQGVLTQLAYDRDFAKEHLGATTPAMPSNGAFTMSGGTTSIEEMIAATERGIYVTRFSSIQLIDRRSLQLGGVTRDGTWLIEQGKITKAIKNMRFSDSPLAALNRVTQVGVPQRVFHPYALLGFRAGPSGLLPSPAIAPVVVPALTIEDFNFTSISNAT